MKQRRLCSALFARCYADGFLEANIGLTRDPHQGPWKLKFEGYKTDSLERISSDMRFAKHHAEIEVILRNREGHLSVKRGIEVLTEIAQTGKTTNYKIFYESCVGGDTTWNHTKMGRVAKFLGSLQRYCADNDLPVLTALVVNTRTGQCGAGFFKDLVALGHASSFEDPKVAAQTERQRCWSWAAAL